MKRLIPTDLPVTLGLSLIVVFAIPALALFLAVGWAWRFWIAAASRLMSFANFQHQRRTITS